MNRARGVAKLPPEVDCERRLRRSMPTQADVRAAFRDKVVDHPDGTYSVTLRRLEDRLKWREIKQPWNRAANDVLQENNARVERVRMLREGSERFVPAHLAETCERAGLRVPFHSGARRRRCDGSDYDPTRRLRTSEEIMWGSDERNAGDGAR